MENGANETVKSSKGLIKSAVAAKLDAEIKSASAKKPPKKTKKITAADTTAGTAHRGRPKGSKNKRNKHTGPAAFGPVTAAAGRGFNLPTPAELPVGYVLQVVSFFNSIKSELVGK